MPVTGGGGGGAEGRGRGRQRRVAVRGAFTRGGSSDEATSAQTADGIREQPGMQEKGSEAPAAGAPAVPVLSLGLGLENPPGRPVSRGESGVRWRVKSERTLGV